QFMMTALVAGNLKDISSLNFKNYQIILLTSLLFSLVHYPYGPLMVYAFLMEILFTITYFRWKNLWPLGIYHGWVSSLLLFLVMGRDLWSELWRIF
ncbi:MAG TPA: CPBP family intramembrane glutamic endopeptidase, partial [Bacteroidales bacterium]|nr:CPBP family intramembrane glutamic endopeptidase [Bacteroidales bacterium]